MNNQTQQPSPMEIYNQLLYDVNARYGVPMGRSNIGTKQDAERKKLYRRHVPLVYDGAYDKGGAYWGCGAPLYVEYTLDKSYVAFFRKNRNL